MSHQLQPLGHLISHITIDHLPKELSFNVTNAPRNIKVWGFLDRKKHLSHATSGQKPIISPSKFVYFLIATFHYSILLPDHIQTFPVMFLDMAFDGVVVEVLSNWGGERTCLYRVRVHGERG